MAQKNETFPPEIRVNGYDLSADDTRFVLKVSVETVMIEFDLTRREAKRVKIRARNMIAYWEPEYLEYEYKI